MREPNSWVVHGLECDDGHKLPPTELVLRSDLDEERESSIALMRLLADERLKSGRLISALAGVCERGDTDHSAKSMYWIASNALKAEGFRPSGKPIEHESKNDAHRGQDGKTGGPSYPHDAGSIPAGERSTPSGGPVDG